MLKHARIIAAAATAACLAALSSASPGARAGQGRSPDPPNPPDALQVVADVVLIEAECRSLNVDYGRLFAYAERNGIRPVDVMPLGERRAAFDADYRRRAREAKDVDLCGALAAARDAAVPGVFTAR